MRAHYLQHVPFEGLGSIEDWLRANNDTITQTGFFETSWHLPEPEDIDLLIILGGPMSVNDVAAYPWLTAELQFIRQCLEVRIPTLGICLGAQLIARASGAQVYPNPHKEIGWFPIMGTGPQQPDTFIFPASQRVFHWHGETFDLPTGAQLLARSQACPHQAFQLGRSVLGLQFHLETTPASALALVAHCRDELVPGLYIQSEQAILAASPADYQVINQLMVEVLQFLRAGVSC
ncbi:gamma-glutamyl-gamma-aminobutyrate hydrolase family protein [Synechocystis sp. LKSZ1]|uniref:type 1 glutamine amidotransferase n=1 Tax=Synechocystis sp. LKSZ1 TaxID=3144951 RepID=UPI00336C2DF6